MDATPRTRSRTELSTRGQDPAPSIEDCAYRCFALDTPGTLTTVLSSRVAGVRLVSEHSASWVPPMFEHGLLPPAAIGPLKLLPRSWAGRVTNALPNRVRFYCGGFNRIAAELGVPGVPSTVALVLGDLTLVTEAPEVLGLAAERFEAWRGGRGYRPGTRLRVTGPLFARLPIPLPGEVERFLSGPGPIVYVAVTSSDAGLVRSVVAGLRPLGARILVAGTVHELDDLAGDRVLVGGVLPSHLIMPRVDLAVTSGGQGSVQTAMASGVPLMGLPLQPEQDLNVALIERRGAGLALAPRHAAGARVAALAGRLLSEDRYRRAAREISEVYAAIDGAGNAAEAILAA
jgi:hypothetical protein